MLVLKEGGGEKMVDLLSGVDTQFFFLFIQQTKCRPGLQDSERTQSLAGGMKHLSLGP